MPSVGDRTQGETSGPDAVDCSLKESTTFVRAGKIGGHDVSFELGDPRRESRELARQPAADLAWTTAPARRSLCKDRCGDNCKSEEQRCDSVLHGGAFHWGAIPAGRPGRGHSARRPVYSFAGRNSKSIFTGLRPHRPSGLRASATEIGPVTSTRSMVRRLYSKARKKMGATGSSPNEFQEAAPSNTFHDNPGVLNGPGQT